MTANEIKEKLEKMERSSIRLKIEGEAEEAVGSSRFGGAPDVPEDFVWPVFETDTFDDKTVKPRPLSFLAQFRCEELAPYDSGELLPKTGVLSFFYEIDSQKWGYAPQNAGCARVYWFEDIRQLSRGEFPQSLEEELRFPEMKIKFERIRSLPDYEDFACGFSGEEYNGAWDVFRKVIGDKFSEVVKESYTKQGEPCPKLLGWANIIQNCMAFECELVSRGYYLGDWKAIPREEIKDAKKHCCDEWLLLFQLSTMENDDFELMFGDCGCIYFYIRKEDLEARRFDKTWLILQCT